jgi:TonB family protein
VWSVDVSGVRWSSTDAFTRQADQKALELKSKRMTRPNALIGLLVAMSALTGCATSGQAGNDEEEGGGAVARAAQQDRERARESRRRHDPVPAMKLDNEIGVLETADVEDTLQNHFGDVRACYRRAGKAQQYAGGRVLLRFLVAGDGHAEDVWVVESSLGNYSVERCLVEVGRRVVFGAPSGRKATTFDYPVEFRSTNQVTVLDIDGLKIDHDLAAFMPQLAACGPVAKEAVAAIMYIEPTGFPGSVGLAAGTALDEDAGDCVVQTIRRWKMSAVLPGHVLRANFSIPTMIATADPPRRAVSSASVRRRRR